MWDRRHFLGSCMALVTSASAVQAQGVARPDMRERTITREACIDICLKSHRMCLETARYCTEKGGYHAAPARLAALLDCAEMCQTTANSLLRTSPLHAVICGACAQLCEACAKDCDAIADDEQLMRCASMCRDCAQDCRAMVVRGY
jgi:hypothetical protein